MLAHGGHNSAECEMPQALWLMSVHANGKGAAGFKSLIRKVRVAAACVLHR